MNPESFIAEHFEPVLAERGLERLPGYSPPVVQAKGVLGGRKLHLYFSRRSRTKYYGEVRFRKYAGHQLTITITESFGVRMSLSRGSGAGAAKLLSRWLGMKEFKAADFDSLQIFTKNPEWCERFFREPRVQEIIRDRLFDKDAMSASFAIQPEMLCFSQRLPFYSATKDRVEAWLDSLEELAEIAHRLGPADPPETLTAFERRIQGWGKRFEKRPFAAAMLLLGALMLVVLLLTPLFILLLPILMPVLILWVLYSWIKGRA